MRRRVPLLALLVLAGAACASAPPPPGQFALDYAAAPAGQTVAAVQTGRLGVAAFGAKAFYNSQRVAWRNGPRHDHYSAGKWETVPRTLLTEAVLAAARADGGFAGVQPHPAAWGPPPTLVIRGRIEAFDVRLDGEAPEAHIAARIALTDPAGRTAYWEGVLERRGPIAGGGMDAIVAAFEETQAALADAIVAEARRVATEQAALAQTTAAAGGS